MDPGAEESINIVSVNKKFPLPIRIYRIRSIFRNNEKIAKIRPQNSLSSRYCARRYFKLIESTTTLTPMELFYLPRR